MNQSLGTFLAFVFLLCVGVFNLTLGISNIRKKNRSHFAGWLRIVLALLLFIATAWFVDKLNHGFFE